MRICLLVDRLDARGGAQDHLQDLARALSPEHDLLILGGAGRPVGWPEGAKVRRVRGLAAPEADPGELQLLDPLLDQAEVVHAQNLMNPLAIRQAAATGKALFTIQDHRAFCPGPGRRLPGGTACRLPFEEADCTTCLGDQDLARTRRDWTRDRRDALRGARLVVLSRYMADELALAGLPGAIVLPPPVPVGAPRMEAGQGLVITGRLVHHKGVDLAWAAWQQAGAPLPLQVAGAGRLAPLLEGATHHGWLDRPRLRFLLRSARAAIALPRWQEPFGIASVEALAEGTAVIAGPRGGMTDWAEWGTLRVEPEAVAEASEAIRRLQADPALALRLGQEGQARVAEAYEPSALLDRLLGIYEAVRG